MMNLRLNYSAANCSAAAALAIVGEKWTLLVLREAFFGLRRFEEMQQALGCARNVLSDRLAKLVEHGLLERQVYQENSQRARNEYRLTPSGIELYPVLVALMQWGDRWLAKTGEPPVEVHHSGCEATVAVELRCARGHGPLLARETYAVPGKGARLAVRSASGSQRGP